MRTLAITQNITVDGSIEFLDNWFDPQWQNSSVLSDRVPDLRLIGPPRSFDGGITLLKYAGFAVR